MANKLNDLTGQRFGKLTVLRRGDQNAANGKARWICSCDCGNQVNVRSDKLRSGNTLSCKCHQRQTVLSHGHAGHPMYSAWHRMKKIYPDDICARWLADFQHFLDDMNPTWKSGLTLFRKDKDRPFCTNNCGWASRKVQARNRTNTPFIPTPKGTMALSAAADYYGVPYQHLYYRVKRSKLPPEKWFTPAKGNQDASDTRASV